MVGKKKPTPLEQVPQIAEDLRRQIEDGATVLEPGPVSLDFWRADKLRTIEDGIRDAAAGVALSVAATCRALHRIQAEQLYQQAGLPSFQEYLKANRLPFPKSTASEYAKIGRALTVHDRELRRIRFEDADGLKKLLYLESALQQGEDPGEVFQRLKRETYLTFRDYARGLSGSGVTGPGSHVRTEQDAGALLDKVRRALEAAGPKTRAAILDGLARILKDYKRPGR